MSDELSPDPGTLQMKAVAIMACSSPEKTGLERGSDLPA